MLSGILRLSLLIIVIGTAAAQTVPPQPTFYARQDLEGFECQQPQGSVLIVDTNGDGIPDIVCSPMLLGNGDGTFRSGLPLSFPDQVGGAIANDVNGDGKADLVYPASEGGISGIGVMLGNGDGTFQPAVLVLSGVSGTALHPAVVMGDFNGDGNVDIAELLAEEIGTQDLVIFTGLGNGSFSVEAPITISIALPFAIAATDLNGDGRPDIVIDGLSSFDVFLGIGNGTFQAEIITDSTPYGGFAFGAMAVGDLNGDGIPDIALSSQGFTFDLLYPGKGDGTFGSPSEINLPGGFLGLAIADLNGDGIPDLVNDYIEVAFGKGGGKFKAPVYYPADGAGITIGENAVAVADLRNDGRMDVVAAGEDASILLNDGKGILQDGVKTTTPASINCAATGDFNGDGIPDLALSNGSAIEIYLGTGKAAAPFKAGATYAVQTSGCPLVGDLNGDGILDLFVPSGPYLGTGSVVGFLGNGDGTFQQGPSSPLASVDYFVLGDFNGDGKLDYASNANLLALGNGDGSFGVASSFIPFIYSGTGATGFSSIGTADLNGDGRPDIVLTDYGDSILYVLLNHGGNGFQETATKSNPTCLLPSFITFGDVNADGKPDVVLGCEEGIGVFLNNGSGGFKESFRLAQEGSEYSIPVVADLNGDGIVDIGSQGFDNIAVFLGEGADTFAAPFYVGSADNTEGFFVLNTHRQNPKRGTPDLVVAAEAGVIYTLINETK